MNKQQQRAASSSTERMIERLKQGQIKDREYQTLSEIKDVQTDLWLKMKQLNTTPFFNKQELESEIKELTYKYSTIHI